MEKSLGIDYGEKNIGLALGVGDIFQPLSSLSNRPNHHIEKEALKNIVSVIEDENIKLVVIGLPLLNGKETKGSILVEKFGNKLMDLLSDDVIVKYVDEFRTSLDSVQTAINAGIPQKKRKDDHSLAACEILRRYLSTLD